MTVKSLSAYLVVDWRDEDLKVRKTKPETSPYEVAVPLDLEIEVPEIDVQSLSARLEVPQANVHEIVQGEVHDEELLDWQVTAESVLEDRIGPDPDPEQLKEDSVEQVLGAVMLQAPGVPDPEKVRDYLDDRIEHIIYE